MRLVDELQQLPSSTAIKILGLLDLDESKRKQIEGELACLWIEADDVPDTAAAGGTDGFCWFEQLRHLPACLIKQQLMLMNESDCPLTDKEVLVIRFTILFCAGKIVPDKKSITESQLRVLLAVLQAL